VAPKSVSVPMIRRVRLHNFRSIADCDVGLRPLTILVGPNGSGKSNFLHALDFLADALNNGLEGAVRRHGRLTAGARSPGAGARSTTIPSDGIVVQPVGAPAAEDW
jgi:predicted ATPase